jgi:DNA polymerase-1
MTLQVHDELLFEIPRTDLEGFSHDLCPIMQNAMKLAVPLVVELRVGDNWEELKHYAVAASEPVGAGSA